LSAGSCFLFHLEHKDPNVTACAAAGLRVLVSRSAEAALSLVLDAVRSLVELDIAHTHPHCRVEVARALAQIQCKAAAAALTPTSPAAPVAALLGSEAGVAAISFLMLANHAPLQEEALAALTAGRSAAARGIGTDPLASDTLVVVGTSELVRLRVEQLASGAGAQARALAVGLLDEASRVRGVEFAAGARVHISGLQSAAQYNDMTATVLRLELPSGRYAVELDEGKQMKVKPGNLRACGTVVE
jgi:hypothetical protein